MTSSTSRPPSHDLPVTGDLRLLYGLSLTVALILAVASVAGLVYPERLYPTEALLQSNMPNDLVNLVIGLPFLLISMGLTRRGRLIGLLLWPGALFYVVYNAIAYLLSLPLNLSFLLSLVLLTLSIYTIIGLVSRIDGLVVKRRLDGAVPARLAGGVLIGLGGAFYLRAIGVVIQGLLGSSRLPQAELAVSISDALTAPASFVGGMLLWQRRPCGYAVGAGLLAELSVLFVALIAFMVLQPLVTDAPFLFVDTVIVLLMALIALIPTGLFLRGVISKE